MVEQNAKKYAENGVSHSETYCNVENDKECRALPRLQAIIDREKELQNYWAKNIVHGQGPLTVTIIVLLQVPSSISKIIQLKEKKEKKNSIRNKQTKIHVTSHDSFQKMTTSDCQR